MIVAVWGNSRAQPAVKIAFRIPFVVSTVRNPNFLRIGVTAVFISKLPMKSPSIRSPD